MSLLDIVNEIEEKEATDRLGNEPLVDEEVQQEVEEEQIVEEIEDEQEEEVVEEDKSATSFNKKRKEIRQLKQEKQELAERLARLEGAFEQSQRVALPVVEKPVNTDPEPDPVYDKEDHLAWQIRQQGQELHELKQFKQQSALQMQINAAKEELGQYESEYSQKRGDYSNAKDYLTKSLLDEIKAVNPNISPVEAKQQVDLHLLKVASNAAAARQHPAEVLARIAESRGYKATKESIKVGNNLDAIRKNKEKAGMPSASSRGVPEVVTSNQLYKMTLAEQAKIIDKNWEELR